MRNAASTTPVSTPVNAFERAEWTTHDLSSGGDHLLVVQAGGDGSAIELTTRSITSTTGFRGRYWSRLGVGAVVGVTVLEARSKAWRSIALAFAASSSGVISGTVEVSSQAVSGRVIVVGGRVGGHRIENVVGLYGFELGGVGHGERRVVGHGGGDAHKSVCHVHELGRSVTARFVSFPSPCTPFLDHPSLHRCYVADGACLLSMFYPRLSEGEHGIVGVHEHGAAIGVIPKRHAVLIERILEREW